MIKRITIVGVGRVGGSLDARLLDKGVEVRAIRRNEFDEWSAKSEDLGEITVIAVRDPDTRLVADAIAKNNRVGDTVVIHVNGSQRLDVLSACEAAGARVAAAHPFQTFADVNAATLDNIGWGIECSNDVWPLLKEFVELTNGVAHRLDIQSDEHKRVYHASAIAASNFTYAAYELGRRLAKQAGIPDEAFLLPIIERTRINAAKAITDNAPLPVTGPIQRGDVMGVARQLEAIPAHEKEVYIYLALALLHLNKDDMSGSVFNEMSSLLKKGLEGG